MGFYIWTENYNGGINNLWVVQEGVYGVRATSLKSKEQAIINLERKLKKSSIM